MERVEWGSESVTERLEFAVGRNTAITSKQRAILDSFKSVIDAPVFALSDLDTDDREAALQLIGQGFTLTEIISSM